MDRDTREVLSKLRRPKPCVPHFVKKSLQNEGRPMLNNAEEQTLPSFTCFPRSILLVPDKEPKSTSAVAVKRDKRGKTANRGFQKTKEDPSKSCLGTSCEQEEKSKDDRAGPDKCRNKTFIQSEASLGGRESGARPRSTQDKNHQTGPFQKEKTTTKPASNGQQTKALCGRRSREEGGTKRRPA